MTTIAITPQQQILHTTDHWHLQLLYFAPRQICCQYPILCIHGFAQSHRTWTVDGFANKLAALGFHTYALDLRGHGGSSANLQIPPLPDDIAFAWDTNSYLDGDIPAAMAHIQSQHDGCPLILCGHSLGGILAVITAIRHSEQVAALVPIAAPLDPCKIGAQLRWSGRILASLYRLLPPIQSLCQHIPTDLFFRTLDSLYFRMKPNLHDLLPLLMRCDTRQIWPQIWNPALTRREVVRELLQHASAETMGVILDLSRWAKHRVLDFGKPNLTDYIPLFPQIRQPVFAVWGQDDILAPPSSGETFFHSINSHHRQCLILPHSRHIDLTAGSPTQNIIDKLMLFLRACIR